ncbi:MAG: M16 family metallopeptidase [Planctomycetota bacterium]|jgi:zinc protease
MRILAPFALLLLATTLFADEPLPVDPAIKTGKLDNGLTFWIRPHKTPPDRVGMMLHIGSGSLNEDDDQRGLAHFLEHMAFNGSANFPPGEMVKYFESLGMQFGQHQNAFTSFNQTTYMMHLPNSKPETIDKVLVFLVDVAHRLTLPIAEIDKERGVILEEKRSRSGPQMRMMEKILPIIAPGSRLSERMPIGIEDVITKAPRERFEQFYKKWYRPEQSVLIVSGDIDAAAVEKQVRAAFAGWKRSESEPTHANAGIKFDEPGLRAAIVTDPEVTRCDVGLSRVRRFEPPMTLLAHRSALVERLGAWILRQRLREIVRAGKASFQSSSVAISPFMSYATSIDTDASGDPDRCLDMFHEVLVEVRRGRLHGFLDQEVASAKKAMLANAERAAERAPTMNSAMLLMRMNSSVERGRPPMSPGQALATMRSVLPSIERAEIETAFKKAFQMENGLIVATLPEGANVPTKEQLIEVVGKARTAKVEPPSEDSEKKTFLAKDPMPGVETSVKVDEGLGVHSMTYENGARVHVRRMDYKKDQVLVRIRFNGAGLHETKDNVGITTMAGLAIQPGTRATKRLTRSDIAKLLIGRKFSAGGGTAQDALVFSISASPADLEDAFRLAYASMTEPKLVESSVKMWRQQMTMAYGRIRTSVPMQGQMAVRAALSGDDPRVRMPTEDEIAKLKLADAQAWLEQLLAESSIEAAIVGDIDVETAKALAAKYIGSLAKRPALDDGLPELRKVKIVPGPHDREITVDTITPKAMVAVGWRGAAYGNRPEQRILVMATQVLTPRLNKAVREDRGLTYSIQAMAQPSLVFDGTGMIGTLFTADPDKAAGAADVALNTMKAMAADQPPTAEEIAAVEEQLRNIIGQQTKEPSFWVERLANLVTSGRDMGYFDNLNDYFDGIKPDEIVAMLKKYMTKERAFQVIAKPK